MIHLLDAFGEALQFGEHLGQELFGGVDGHLSEGMGLVLVVVWHL